MKSSIEKEVKIQEENLNLPISFYKVSKIDYNLNTVVVHLYY